MADDPTIPVSVTGQPQTFAESPTSVMVEVRGPDRALVDRRMIRVNAPPTPMGLAGPGLHAIRATLGSGVVLEEDIVFEGGTVPGVTFNLFDQSPHESLQRVATVHPLAGQPAGILTASSYVSAWARLFERHGSEWRPVTPPLDLRASEWNDDAVRYGLQLGRRQYVLQVGAPGIAPIMTALPALGTTDVVFQPVLEPDGRPGFRLSVVPASEEAATLLGYLGRGEVRAIESMLEEDTATGRLGSARPDDIELAELVLYEKLSDPNTAALGGYHLLRVGDLERLHNWPANLAEWMDWMSDGSIIRGWQLLRGGGRRRRRETPRRRFLEAVERGLPVYAEGLRLLIDGLKVLNHQDPDDEAVAAAIELMGEYAAATDWSHAVLSFSGSGPSSPSRQVELKAMAGEAGVLMLHSVTTEDLVARRLLRPGTRLSVNRPRFSMSSPGQAVVGDTGLLMSKFNVYDDPKLALLDVTAYTDGWREVSTPDGAPLADLRQRARQEPVQTEQQLLDSILSVPLHNAGLSSRSVDLLARAGLTSLGDVASFGPDRLETIAGIGPRRADEVTAALSSWAVVGDLGM